ncbi:U11/U12 small nuclear ribonucleoprotein 25 kDa protein isoform X3 [Ananas comosus]|uniref:U11/U12 small nuclear ribonucleoprotein 25 kDa protein isoform X3 n=1 Tax=Ananas comosus TaxID=4615 RepID=A0A6P5FGC5_ANACO|nr:U11/U12 small nuclear ribonucleoprotein 25 kDa protein isoform X3 [Ananas comosus]
MDSGSKSEEIASYNNSSAKKSRLQSMLSALLDDPILSDVPKKPSLADVDTLLNLELGSAMKITIVKMDSTSFVKDLKLAIGKKINEIEQARMGHRHISWRHIWANYCLTHHNDKLIDDNSLLSEHGIQNNSKVHFLPFITSRIYQKHSRRRKHRFFHGLSKRS